MSAAIAPSSHRLSKVFHGPAFHTGLLTGVLLALALVGSLFAANRVPAFDSVAWLRNLLSSCAFGVLMAIPVVRFYRSPGRLFRAGMTAWIVFVLAYSGEAMYFPNLVNRLEKTPFLLLVLGAVTYGVIAVMFWVLATLFSVLRHPAPQPAIAKVISPPR
ncbi:MAG: hypothetical protein WA002_02000 [Candidatus Acidiferrales bacterium]